MGRVGGFNFFFVCTGRWPFLVFSNPRNHLLNLIVWGVIIIAAFFDNYLTYIRPKYDHFFEKCLTFWKVFERQLYFLITSYTSILSKFKRTNGFLWILIIIKICLDFNFMQLSCNPFIFLHSLSFDNIFVFLEIS